MPALTTYAELKAAIKAYVSRTDQTVANSDSFTPADGYIRLCEQHVSAQYRIRQMLCRSVGVIDAEFEALQSNLAGVKAVIIRGSQPTELKYADAPQINAMKTCDATAGKPTHYNVADTYQFYPVPDGEYTVEYLIYEQVPALSDTRTTNWLLTRFPGVYLNFCLREAARYQADMEALNVYDAALAECLDAMHRSDLNESQGQRPAQSLRRFG